MDLIGGERLGFFGGARDTVDGGVAVADEVFGEGVADGAGGAEDEYGGHC